MKERVQETGVCKWFGDDWVKMQNELMFAVQGLISDYGNCILAGCTVTDNQNSTYTLSDGLAYLLDSNGQNGKICRVYGQANIPFANFPLYLVQESRDKTEVPAYGRVYQDSQVKNIIVEYYGEIQSNQPSHSQYLTITYAGTAKRFRDALQDATHRFATDTEKATWNGKVAGPASATDNAIARMDGTGGKTLQNSLATVDDSGNMNIPSGAKYKVNNAQISTSDLSDSSNIVKKNVNSTISGTLTVTDIIIP